MALLVVLWVHLFGICISVCCAYSQDLENQPLLTSAMRKAKLEEEYGKYDRVVIRVQFQDKLTLQGLFRPRETGRL